MGQSVNCICGHAWQSEDALLQDARCPACGRSAVPVFSSPVPVLSGPSSDPEISAAPTFPGLEILEELAPGVGGMGVVYKAREPSLDRIVAVKTTKARLHNAEGRAFFLREARSAAKLDHPNILRIYRFNPEHVPPFYVMQYVDGRPLDRAVRERDSRFIAEILQKIARALAYAHANGIIHRDIKPDNILIDFDNEPHIADFGLAGQWADAASAVGTPSYMAPELFSAASASTPAIDIYALGVTLYQLLTGRLPFAGSSLDDFQRLVQGSDPPLPQEINPSVPEPLQRICLKAMERDPAARYESAAAMADDLRRFLDGRDVWARPTRYQAELHGRLQNHLTDIGLWQAQRLIDLPEMDRLSRPYRSMLQAPYPWHVLSRRFPWEAVVLRVGGWLVLLSSLLWLIVYWKYLDRGQSVLAIGLPTLAMALVGWILYVRHSYVHALIYLSTGALLVPLFAGVLLAEFDLCSYPQAGQRELFDRLTRTADHPPEPIDPFDRHGRPLRRHFFPTNMQTTLAAAAFVAYCLLLLLATDANLLSVWAGAGLYLLFTGVLLRLGLREWLMDDPTHIARALSLYMAFALLFWPLSLALGWLKKSRPWSGFVYGFFPLPFAIFFSLLAYHGSREWLHLPDPILDSNAANLWLMLDGMIYFAAALYSRQAQSSSIRFWGGLLMLLVPLHLIAPPYHMFDRGQMFFAVGAQPLGAYEVSMLFLTLALVAMGTRLRYLLLTLSGLLGLALFILKATHRHFQDYLSWPLSLAIVGSFAMAAALVSLLLRARRQREPLI